MAKTSNRSPATAVAVKPKRTGRPPIPNREELMAKICAGLSEGQTLQALCREPGMPKPSTVYDWLAADAELSVNFARARELGFDVIADGILTIVDNIREDPASRRVRADTRLKLLAKWDPKRYGDRQTVEVGNKEGEALKVEQKVDVAGLALDLAKSLRKPTQ